MLLPVRCHIHCTFQGMAILWFEIIPFAVNLMPIRQGVSVRIEIVLMVVDDLPAGLIIIRGAICVPPSVDVMMPANLILWNHLSSHIPLELLPVTRVVHKPLGAYFPGHIIVPDESPMHRVQSPALTDIRAQLHVGCVGGCRESAGTVWMACLNANRVRIGRVGAPAYLILRYHLDDFTLQADDVVGAGLGAVGLAQVLEVVPIGLGRGSRIAYVVAGHCGCAAPLGPWPIVVTYC